MAVLTRAHAQCPRPIARLGMDRCRREGQRHIPPLRRVLRWWRPVARTPSLAGWVRWERLARRVSRAPSLQHGELALASYSTSLWYSFVAYQNCALNDG